MKRILGGAAAVVVALATTCGGIYGYGNTLPVGHTATVERELAATPAAIYALVGDPEVAPTWRSGVQSVEILPPRDGRPRWRERGDQELVVELVESDPPHRLVTRVVDNPDFGGTWTWELTPSAAGTRVKVTEDGQVYNPLFRVAMRHVFGETATMDSVLDDLQAHALRP